MYRLLQINLINYFNLHLDHLKLVLFLCWKGRGRNKTKMYLFIYLHLKCILANTLNMKPKPKSFVSGILRRPHQIPLRWWMTLLNWNICAYINNEITLEYLHTCVCVKITSHIFDMGHCITMVKIYGFFMLKAFWWLEQLLH